MTSAPENPTLAQEGVGEFGKFYAFIKDALNDDTVRAQVFSDLGVDPANIPSNAPRMDSAAQIDSIELYRKTVNPDKEAFLERIADLKELYEAVRAIVEAANVGGSETAEEVTHRLFRLMSLHYLRVRYPIFFWLGQAAGFIEESFSIDRFPDEMGDGFVDVFKRVGEFFTDPEEALQKTFGHLWPIETEEDAKTLADATLAPLGVLIGFWNKTLLKWIPKYAIEMHAPRVLYGWEGSRNGTDTPVGDRLAAGVLSFSLDGLPEVTPKDTPDPVMPCTGEPSTVANSRIDMALAWVPRVHGGPGLLVSAGGAHKFGLPLGDGFVFNIELSSAAAVDFFIRDWDDVDVGGPSDAAITFTIERAAEAGARYVIGFNDGVQLEFEALSVSMRLDYSGPTFRLLARNAALILKTETDSVLGRVAGSGEMQLEFDLGLIFENGKFRIDGSTDLQATLPIKRSLGPLTVQSLTVGLAPSTDEDKPDLSLEFSTTMLLQLGGLTLVVDRVGFSGKMDFWETPDLGWKKPTGIGIEINSDAVRGGGYLFYDEAKSQYGGVLDLELTDLFTVKAIGVLNTKMPDGSDGFSFIAILFVEDLHIKLPLGFQITGFGGLFGYDRTVSFPALQSGLKNRTLDHIMFPPDPIANAPAIVNTVATVFPAARDQTLVGAMVQVTWGGEVVTIELGVVYEWPNPERFIILGKLRALFPHKKLPVVKIQVDLIGEIDLQRKQAFVHAVLVDSKLAGFPLTGAAAMLLRWGDDPVFVLAFGGVHPRYEQRLPAGFPKLERLSVALTRGNNPRIRLEHYVAVTSNSFQIGGKLEVFASIGKFSVDGMLAVDALFQEGEPSVIFDLAARLQIKAWGVNLFTAKFAGTFQGWHPSNIRGKATFSIWIFDYSIPIDHTFGKAAAPPPLPPVDVRTPLLAALRDPRNWETMAPDSGLVTLRSQPAPAGEILMHPLGRLKVNQRVVPLNLTVDRVGQARPAGGAQFKIEPFANVGGRQMSTSPLSDKFARAQYFDMTDDEKLSAPAFESMPAGVEIGSSGVTIGAGIASSTDYETFIYDPIEEEMVPADTYSLSSDRLSSLAEIGPISKRARFGGPKREAKVAWSRYVVASTDDLSETAVPGVPAGGARTYSEAVAAMRAHTAAHPEQRSKLQLVVTNA